MPYTITPSTGIDLNLVGPTYIEEFAGSDAPALGSAVMGSDGRMYVRVVAGVSQISANAAVIFDDATFVASAGAGNFRPPADQIVPANTTFWARQIAIPGSDA